MPTGFPTDWTPATVSNLAGASFTFTLDETDEAIVAEFNNPAEAMMFIANTGMKFEYSRISGAVRVGDAVVPLPKQPKARRACTYKECDLRAVGHNQHYIPVLRALNQKDMWFPIDVVEQEGAKITFTFNSPRGAEIVTAYNHNPEQLAKAQEYNPDWRVLRYTTDAGSSYTAILLSMEPPTPCTVGE